MIARTALVFQCALRPLASLCFSLSLWASYAPAEAATVSRSIFLRSYSMGTVFASSTSMMMSTATSKSRMWSSDRPIETAMSLLESVHGPVESSNHPLPMPADEAGLCANGVQRRYLWTDAFGVIAYTSLAEHFQRVGNEREAQTYREAASRLINVVHECLGKPRSNKPVDAMQADTTHLSPTGYIGLRIGKVHSKQITDYGMQYDGQYWHYIDKWLFALARANRIDDGIRIAKSVFPHFFDAGPHGDGRNGGIRWKLSIDGTPPPELTRAYASDDTLVALIMFSILENARERQASVSNDSAMPLSLSGEIDLLQRSLQFYNPRVTDDPLGWGLEAIYDQFLEGHPRRKALASIHQRALDPRHLSLPFRLYGAMIGAKIAGEAIAPSSEVSKLIDISLDHQAQAFARGREEHSSINRVMLAVCLLCPGTLGRQENDPVLVL